MPSSASSHNFSLPSTIFRSASEANLRSTAQNSSSLYSTPAHCATENALPYLREEASPTPSTDDITALPPQEQQPRRKKSLWRLPSSRGTADESTVPKKCAPVITTTVVASSINTETVCPPRKPAKAAWDLIVRKFKSPFARLKKRRSPKTSPRRNPVVISAPSNFQHLASRSGMPLRRANSQHSIGDQRDAGEGGRAMESDWEDVEE